MVQVQICTRTLGTWFDRWQTEWAKTGVLKEFMCSLLSVLGEL